MAHYVFQRDNGCGDLDFIQNFETMAITDFPQYAAQIEDKHLAHLDIGYLNKLGFYAVGIRSFSLRIEPSLLFRPVAGGAYKSAVKPRNPRAHKTPKPQPHPRRRAASKCPHSIVPEELLGAILKAFIPSKYAPKNVRIPKKRRRR